MRALHQVVTRTADVRRGIPVFAGTRVPLRALIDHLDQGGDTASFAARHPAVSRAQILEACALGLEALSRTVPLEPAATQRSLLPRTDAAGAVVNAEELSAGQVVGRRVLCPACRTLVFRAWPGGWDAHAATRCRGVAAGSAEARKAEFKRRFAALFR